MSLPPPSCAVDGGLSSTGPQPPSSIMSQDEFFRHLELQSVHCVRFVYRQALKERLRATTKQGSLNLPKPGGKRFPSTQASAPINTTGAGWPFPTKSSCRRIFKSRSSVPSSDTFLSLRDAFRAAVDPLGSSRLARSSRSSLAPLLRHAHLYLHPGARRDLEKFERLHNGGGEPGLRERFPAGILERRVYVSCVPERLSCSTSSFSSSSPPPSTKTSYMCSVRPQLSRIEAERKRREDRAYAPPRLKELHFQRRLLSVKAKMRAKIVTSPPRHLKLKSRLLSSPKNSATSKTIDYLVSASSLSSSSSPCTRCGGNNTKKTPQLPARDFSSLPARNNGGTTVTANSCDACVVRLRGCLRGLVSALHRNNPSSLSEDNNARQCDLCRRSFTRHSRMVKHVLRTHAAQIHKVNLAKFVPKSRTVRAINEW